ncbi:MAG: Dps family protein [Cryomorphaceae bacterium]|nr:DNA starvation/stationary phase protection protein [Flavobacteriales bacterium]
MNNIGLDKEKSALLSEKLNHLLADYMVFYQNARGFHWNIKGEKFFELHDKFEELYTDLLVKIDEVAERILTLGKTPLHTFEDYTSSANVKAVKNSSEGRECVASILDSFEKIITRQRDILEFSDDADDEGTNALMSDYIREQEKLVWMYSSYLNR